VITIDRQGRINALNQAAHEPGLEDAHGFAHPGLGDAHLLGGPAEVQLVGEHEEDPQFTWFDVPPHQWGILIVSISDCPLISSALVPEVVGQAEAICGGGR
jgi:hypothetical protein